MYVDRGGTLAIESTKRVLKLYKLCVYIALTQINNYLNQHRVIQVIVAWRAFLPMKTPGTNLVTVFQFGLALTWSEAPYHFKYISIN